MSAIFVSHSSRDTAFVDELRDRLEERGHRSLFVDYDPEFGIPVGREWEKEIYQQLRSCQGVIVVCSASSMGSRWVFAEVTQGKALGKHIFPVKIDDCEIDAILTERQVLDLRARTGDAFGRLWRALETAGLDAASLLDWDGSRSPYPGMVPFHEADAPVFFGREDEIQHGIDLLNRLRRFNQARLAVVLGASGSGKWSLVRAGLLSAVAARRRNVAAGEPIRRRRDAFKETAIALAYSFDEHGDHRSWRDIQRILHAAAEQGSCDGFLELLEDLRILAKQREATILLVVDQAEELLTDGETGSRRFLDLLRGLLGVPDSAVLMLCTLRSDYLGVFQQHPAVNGLAFEALTVGPISRAGLVQVIEGPAEKAGLRLEPGLTEAMTDETQSANAMPLLAFSLRELYEHRDQNGALTIAVYRDQLGGLAGSVKAAAEAVFEASGLPAEQVVDLRDTFLAMVQINEQDRAASRPLRWAEAPERIHPVLERFVQARLLIARGEAGERVLEVAHEALFSAWDRLRTWLDEDRERLRLRERLRQAAMEWIEQDRNPGLLVHRGTRLAETEELLAMPRFRLTDAERAYLAACLAEREAAREGERRRADAARVAVATDWLSRDVGTAALVLIEVQRPDDTPFAVSRMNDAVARGLPTVQRRTHEGGADAATFSPDGRFFVTASADGTAKIWRADGSGDPVVVRDQAQLDTAIYSPDGQLIATAGNDGQTRVWRADGFSGPVVMDRHGEFLAFSPDSRRLVIADEDGAAWVCRVDGTGEPVHLVPVQRRDHEVDAFGEPVEPAWLHRRERNPGAPGETYIGPPHWYWLRTRPSLFSPDSEHVVTPSIDDVALVWQADGSGDPIILQHDDSVLAATFSPDGRHIVTASHDGTARLWPADGAGHPQVLQHDAPVIVALFSPDGRHLATSAEDGTVRIWATEELADPVVLRHERPVYTVQFSPNGEQVLTVDGTVRLWATHGRDEPLVLPHPGSEVMATLSPEGERVLTDSGDGLIRIWSIRPVVFEHGSPVLSAFFSPRADRVVTVARDHMVRIWPIDRRSRSAAIQHRGDVLATAFSPDGTRIITASRDGTAKIQAIDGSTEPVVLHHEAPVNLAAFSPDGTHVVTGAEDGLTRVWRSDAPAEPAVLGPPGSYKDRTEVNAVSFSPDSGRVLSASGPVVRIWPARGAKEPLELIGQHFGGYSEEVSRAWFTPGGQHVVAVGSAVRIWPVDGTGDPIEYRDVGSAGPFGVSADGRHFVLAPSFGDGAVWVFSIDRITEPVIFSGSGEPATLTEMSRDGTKIAIVSQDNAVRVRASDGTGEPSVLRHEAEVRSVAFSHDGERVVTVSEDGSARVWRADGTGETLMLWHHGAVNAASFSPDGDTIVTASDDGTARRWWLNGNSLWRSVGGMMSGCLTPEFRERYLGESPDEARRAHAACERAHDRALDTTDIERPIAPNNGHAD